MCTDDAERKDRPRGSKVERSGEVSMQMTVDDLLSAAINAAQNGWPLEALGHHWMKPNAATQRMLEQIYLQVLEANRLAVEKRLANQGR
jgi:hypothetical protein